MNRVSGCHGNFSFRRPLSIWQVSYEIRSCCSRLAAPLRHGGGGRAEGGLASASPSERPPSLHHGSSSTKESPVCASRPSSPDRRWGTACMAPWKSKSPAPMGPGCSPQITDSSRPKATVQTLPGPPETRCPFCPRLRLAGMPCKPRMEESGMLIWDLEGTGRQDSHPARLPSLQNTASAAGPRESKSQTGTAVNCKPRKGLVTSHGKWTVPWRESRVFKTRKPCFQNRVITPGEVHGSVPRADKAPGENGYHLLAAPVRLKGSGTADIIKQDDYVSWRRLSNLTDFYGENTRRQGRVMTTDGHLGEAQDLAQKEPLAPFTPLLHQHFFFFLEAL